MTAPVPQQPLLRDDERRALGRLALAGELPTNRLGKRSLLRLERLAGLGLVASRRAGAGRRAPLHWRLTRRGVLYLVLSAPD